jgi:hypothetical protein
VDPRRATLEYLARYHDQKGQAWVRNLGVPEGTQFLGAPRWLWREAAQAWVRSRVRGASRQRVPALVEQRRFWWLKGMIKECRRTPSATHASRLPPGSSVWPDESSSRSTSAAEY